MSERLRCGTGLDLDRAVERGEITLADADAVREFAAFLSDPEVGPADAKTPLPMSVLRRHRDILGLTDADLAQAERNRAAGDTDRTGGDDGGNR